jgi:hypothetical protein
VTDRRNRVKVNWTPTAPIGTGRQASKGGMTMRQWSIPVFVMAVAALCTAPLPAAGAAAASATAAPRPVLALARAGVRGTARPVAASAALGAWIDSVSCARAADCSAGATVVDNSDFSHAAVAEQVKGTWGPVQELAGLPDSGPQTAGSGVSSVSCAAPGDCSAGGFNGLGSTQGGFVAGEEHGTWGKAIAVPGLAQLNTGKDADVESVSCGSPGNCGAAGFYTLAPASAGLTRAFVVTEHDGRWGRAQAVALPVHLKGLSSSIGSVSCASAGTCTAVGGYSSGSVGRAFVVTEKHGKWRPAVRILDHFKGFNWGVSVVSCASAGSCSAAGAYSSGSAGQAFVVTEKHGKWDAAQPVPGLARLNTGKDAQINSLSCGSPGNCSAGGYYSLSPVASGLQDAFVVTEKHGVWGAAEQVPGLARLKTGGITEILSVSCASAGDCSAAGSYGYWKVARGFMVTEKNGWWGKAQPLSVPAGGFGGVSSLSCASAGDCTGGGGWSQAFYLVGDPLVVTEVKGTWTRAHLLTVP